MSLRKDFCSPVRGGLCDGVKVSQDLAPKCQILAPDQTMAVILTDSSAIWCVIITGEEMDMLYRGISMINRPTGSLPHVIPRHITSQFR